MPDQPPAAMCGFSGRFAPPLASGARAVTATLSADQRRSQRSRPATRTRILASAMLRLSIQKPQSG